MADLTNARILESREVSAHVTNAEVLYTPKGRRPIEPCSIRITYGLNPTTGAVKHLDVVVSGFPPEADSSRGAVSRRIGDIDQAPQWVRDAIDRFRPEVRRA